MIRPDVVLLAAAIAFVLLAYITIEFLVWVFS